MTLFPSGGEREWNSSRHFKFNKYKIEHLARLIFIVQKILFQKPSRVLIEAVSMLRGNNLRPISLHQTKD